MLSNYLKIAFRNLWGDKRYSAINIFGLAIGLAACLLITLYVQHEKSFETHWEDAGRLYRVNFAADMPGSGVTRFTEVPFVAMPALARYFREEIEASTRVIWRSGVLGQGEAEFSQVLYRVDPAFIELFGFTVVAGDLAAALASPGNIALRADVAEQVFGAENPLGRTVSMEYSDSSRQDFIVTAVYRVPGNTIMDLPVLSRIDESGLSDEFFSWVSLTSDSYFKLKPGVDIESLRERIADFTDRNVDVSAFFPDPGLVTSDVALYSVQAMTDIHLNSPWDTFRELGSRAQVLAFSAIAVLVLLVGCINFTILSTAKATQRAREVAMRKVIGARRGQLILQFLGESFLVVAMAMIVSLALAELMLPVFESFTGTAIEISLASSGFLSAVAVLGLGTAFLGGLYPAFVLSGFYPARTLKAPVPPRDAGGISLRSALIVFQFGVAIALLAATAVIYLQVEYSSERDPGFPKDELLVIRDIDSRRELYGRMGALKQEVLRIPEVASAGFSTWRPSQRNQGFGSYDLLGVGAGNHSIARTGIGYDFFKTYQTPIVAGRDFDRNLDLPDLIFTLDPAIAPEVREAPRNVLINRSAARQLGFADPRYALGRVIRSVNPEDGARNYTIVGVTADTHFYSINALPRAEVFHLTPNRPNILTVRFQGNAEALVDHLAEAWRRVMGEERFTFDYVDQLLAAEFAREKTEARMLLSFSLLAIFIACMGLYGSAAFTVDRRTKEIGIRKVMGAEVREIVAMLMWQFSKPVLLANLVAWPAAMWIMLAWLQRFPYQIDALLLIPLCVLAGFIALSIAWLTVCGNAARVATSKPVYALRYE